MKNTQRPILRIACIVGPMETNIEIPYTDSQDHEKMPVCSVLTLPSTGIELGTWPMSLPAELLYH